MGSRWEFHPDSVLLHCTTAAEVNRTLNSVNLIMQFCNRKIGKSNVWVITMQIDTMYVLSPYVCNLDDNLYALTYLPTCCLLWYNSGKCRSCITDLIEQKCILNIFHHALQNISTRWSIIILHFLTRFKKADVCKLS